MKTVAFLLLFPFLPHLVVAQQAAPTQNPCEEKPISQRQMDDCAAFEYKQADAHLNKVYRTAVQYMTDDLARAQKQGDQKQTKYEETAIASLKEAELQAEENQITNWTLGLCIVDGWRNIAITLI